MDGSDVFLTIASTDRSVSRHPFWVQDHLDRYVLTDC